MDPITGALIMGGASLLSGLFGSDSASEAAQAQAAAQQAAIAEQRRQYNQTRSDLMPYQDMGQASGQMLMGRLGELAAPWQPTQASLEATPGYQFTLNQGLKATQNSAAARGLGLSGAALKGAAGYATGLADNTWQNVFNADQTQKNNVFNKLYNATSLGENAAAQTGNIGQKAADQISQSQSNIGAAQAAGIMGSNNALLGGVNNALGFGYANGLFGNSNQNLLMNAGGAGSGNGWSLFGPGGSL